MAVRNERGAGLRRAALRRVGVAALVVATGLAVAAVATWPALRDARTDFLAGGARDATKAGRGEAAPGDHLQSNYRLWLVGHQLGERRQPWVDPYSFQPEIGPQPNFAGWPFGLVYWPLHALSDDVRAWNAFVLLGYLGALGFTFLWLRAVGMRIGAAVAGGVVFALAPYRVEQSVGHLLGPVSMLLPLALWALERARRGSPAWLLLAAAATVSIPLSGQVHLALGTTPLVLVYALCRAPRPRVLVATAIAAALAVAAAVLYRDAVIAGSIEARGRTLAEVASYSAQWRDFVAREPRHGGESFVFVGWLTPIAAVAGAAVLAFARRWSLLIVLALAVVVPSLLALGTNLPLYETLWHHVPPLRFPRVPERLMPIACLGIAGLVAAAVDRLRPVLLVPLAAVALAADLRVEAYAATPASPGRAAYAALADAGPGRILELPVFLPDDDRGSVYLYYDMTARRERPLGYALAPASTDRLARDLRPLDCGDWRGAGARLQRLGVGSIALHGGLYRRGSNAPWFAWVELLRHGWGPVAQDGVVTMFAPGGSAAVRSPPGPARGELVRCSGWRGSRIAVPPGELWAFGDSTVVLRVRTTGRAIALVSVDGPRVARVTGAQTVRVRLRAPRWHLIRIDRRRHGDVRVGVARRAP